MLASKILKQRSGDQRSNRRIDRFYRGIRKLYRRVLKNAIRYPVVVLGVFVLLFGATLWLLGQIPSEYAPKEDRGAFFVLVNGPEGATFDYMEEYMDEIERRLMPFIESGEATRLLVRAPRGFANIANFNSGIAIFVLSDWSLRRPAWSIMQEVRGRLAGLPGVHAFPVMRQGFGAAIQKPLQFVIGGSIYQELAQWRNILLERIEADNPGLIEIDWDYKETKPQVQVNIDYDRAAEMGVTIGVIG